MPTLDNEKTRMLPYRAFLDLVEMVIELNKLLNQTVRLEETVAMGEERHPMDGISYRKPVAVDLVLTGKEREFKLEGSFKANLTLTCHRCLRSFERSLKRKIDLVFIPRDQMPTGEVDVELADKDMNVASYLDTLDLRQVIDEQVVLALPMKIICSNECKGLCQNCGKDLNEGPCDCSDERIDDRLLVLKEIKKRLFGA